MQRDTFIALLEANKLPWANVSAMPDLSNHPALNRINIETPGGGARVTKSPLRAHIKSGVVPDVGAQNEQLRQKFGG